MKKQNKLISTLAKIRMLALALLVSYLAAGQESLPVTFQKVASEKKVEVFIGDKLFTRFLYPDSLEKPVLFPVIAANGNNVTRGFPLDPQPGDPVDHPHHIGIWFNYESVNGLDFWNNSYAIPAERKKGYGWIKTGNEITTTDGSKGTLSYRANWTNQQNEVLLVEVTRLVFSGIGDRRIIDRHTVLTANTLVYFKDVKDGMLGFRLARALQIPSKKDLEFKDEKAIATKVKADAGFASTGDYLTSEGKIGDSVWSSRARWCMAFGEMGKDTASVIIIDHPANPNYPTFWHARGYGLFAANPLGEMAFTNGASSKNLQLSKGEQVQFNYRIVVESGSQRTPTETINQLADEFAISEQK